MIIEKEVVRNYTQKIVDKYICDLCGDQSQDENWTKDRFQINKITITKEVGYSYPEGGSITLDIFDLCPKCWENKLVPWMANQKSFPRQKEIEF